MTTTKRADRVFRALGDPTRRTLVERLSYRPVPASSLSATLRISLSAVVQHLQVLEESGLVRTEKRGRVRTCHLDPNGFSVLEKWVADRRASWERRYDRLDRLLSESEG